MNLIDNSRRNLGCALALAVLGGGCVKPEPGGSASSPTASVGGETVASSGPPSAGPAATGATEATTADSGDGDHAPLTSVTSTECGRIPDPTTEGCMVPSEPSECSCWEPCPGFGTQCILDGTGQSTCDFQKWYKPDGYVLHCDLPCICEVVEQSCQENKLCRFDEDKELYAIYTIESLDCALRALRDRVRGKFYWTSSLDQDYSENTGTVYLLGDGTALVHECSHFDTESGFNVPVRGQLREPEHFDACIKDADPSERFECLRDIFEEEQPLPQCNYCPETGESG